MRNENYYSTRLSGIGFKNETNEYGDDDEAKDELWYWIAEEVGITDFESDDETMTQDEIWKTFY